MAIKAECDRCRTQENVVNREVPKSWSHVTIAPANNTGDDHLLLCQRCTIVVKTFVHERPEEEGPRPSRPIKGSPLT